MIGKFGESLLGDRREQRLLVSEMAIRRDVADAGAAGNGTPRQACRLHHHDGDGENRARRVTNANAGEEVSQQRQHAFRALELIASLTEPAPMLHEVLFDQVRVQQPD
jgi:hypothetical protein